MRVQLIPSGLAWLDSEIGGFPAAGVVAALGDAGSGKTSLALGSALASLERGRVCFLTSDAPAAVLDASRSLFERDLEPRLARGDLTLLELAPFFIDKARRLGSVEAPLAELGRLLAARQIGHVVFDTFDPMCAWGDAAAATALARAVLTTMQSWRVSVLCTLGSRAPAPLELARTAAACLELSGGELTLRHAAWCRVRSKSAPVAIVQGRGVAARTAAGCGEPDAFDEAPPASLLAEPSATSGVERQAGAALCAPLAAPEASLAMDVEAQEIAPVSATRRPLVVDTIVAPGEPIARRLD